MSIHKLHSSFNSGELSPLMDSRVNTDKYDAGCRRLRNFILHTHGPVFRRPGLEHMGVVANHGIASRLIEFNFSTTTTFVIEMAEKCFRFWKDGQVVTRTVVEDGESKVVDVTAPHEYAPEEFFEVQVKQVNDVCYLAHRNHPPLKLIRRADDNWTCEEVPFRYPPLLDEFVEKETQTTPTVTPLYSSPLEEAPEFTVAPRTPPAPIPTFTIAPRDPGTATIPNPWFALSWTGFATAATGLAGKTVTLEVQKHNGDWAPVTALAIIIPHTVGGPPNYEFRFRATVPASKHLWVERRTAAGAGWTAWSTIAGVLDVFEGIESAAPALTFRLVYGSALVNDLPDHAVVVTPSVEDSGSGPLFDDSEGSMPLVHTLQTPTSDEITATWTLPPFVPAGRFLVWQMIDSSNQWARLWAWGDAGTPLSTALAAAPGIFRLRSSVATTGVTYAFLDQKNTDGHWTVRGWAALTKAAACNTTLGVPTIVTGSTAGRIVGESVTGPGIPSGTTIAAVTSATILTLSHNATATANGVALVFGRPTPWKVRLLYWPETTKGIGTEVVTCNIASGSTTVTLAGTTPTNIRSVGDLVSGPGIPEGTTITAKAGSPFTQITLSNAATETNPAVNLTFTAPAYVQLTGTGLLTPEGTSPIPATLLERQQSGTGGDAATSAVTVPAGDWRARVEVPSGTVVPPGASVTLQVWVPSGTGGSWSAPLMTWALKAGVTNEYIGTLKRAFTTPTLVRLLYRGGTSFRRVAGVATVDQVVYPASKAVTLQVSSVIGSGTMTAMDTSDPPQPYALFEEGHKDSFWQIVHRRDLSWMALTGAGTTDDGIRVSGRWDLFTYGTWTGTVHLERRGVSRDWQVIRSWTSQSDRNVTATGNEEEDVDLRLRVVLSSSTSPRFVLEAADSRSYGLVKITKVNSSSEAEVEVVRTVAATTATTLWAEGAWSDVRGYPAAVAMHEARLWFGGSKYQPQTLWASVSSDFENFRRSTLDDGSMAITLAAESSNSIRWMNSATALLIGTGGEEWALRAGAEGPLGPTNLRAERQSGYSSMALAAKMAHEVTIFVQRDGRRLRELIFNQAQQSFAAGDLTVFAPHMTAGGVRQLAFQQAPTAVLWVVTNDGKLAGMTFERQQEVFGWHLHETDGEVESVAVLHGTPADEVWLTVKRRVVITHVEICPIAEGSDAVVVPNAKDCVPGESVQGTGIPAGTVIAAVDAETNTLTLSNAATETKADAELTFSSEQQRRFVERMQPQAMSADWSVPETLIYSDGAKLFQFDTPQKALSGLEHLEGRECVILADGMVHPRLTVRTGALTLDVPARAVVVGLPYTSELQPMKQEVQLEDGTAQGRRFKLHGVTLRLDHSLGGEVSANADDATLPWARMPNPIILGEPAPLFTGERDLILDSRHEGAVNLMVRQSAPLPLNVTAMVLRFDVYDH